MDSMIQTQRRTRKESIQHNFAIEYRKFNDIPGCLSPIHEFVGVGPALLVEAEDSITRILVAVIHLWHRFLPLAAK